MEEDYTVRGWCISYAVNHNKKGTSSDKIIEDAQKYYGFLFPKNGEIKDITKPEQPKTK